MLRVIPLGGLGEIGLNSMLLECRGEQLMIDCGLMFPTVEMPGVDIVVPDFSYLRERPSRLQGIVLTHAHEDHVGALPFLLRELQVPVYGTRFTLALVRHRMEEMGIDADLREVSPRERFPVGTAFSVEPVRMCHSIPDGVGLVVRTDEGTVIHTGDFKLDGAPIDGHPTDLERLGEIGEEGVLCLLSDSTNAEMEGLSGEEREVAATFERLFATAGPKRLTVSMFASNLNRMQHLLELAERSGRKVSLQGRAMHRNVELATQLGYLRVPSGLLIDRDTAASLAPGRVVVVSTGSQAEPRSGLVQMLQDDTRGPRIGADDLFIFSSRAIPGNERAITGLIDQLLARGAGVRYSGNEPGVHVSGHAGRTEQRRMLDTVRPRHFVPIHGELHHLHAHLGVAHAAGVPGDRLLLARDGDVLAFSQGRGTFSGRIPHGRVFRDRTSGDSVAAQTLLERRQLGDVGVVVTVVAIDRTTLSLVKGPTLHGRGLTDEELAALSQGAAELRDGLLELSPPLRADDALVKEELTRGVRKLFKMRGLKRPTVMPIILRF